MLLKSIQPVQGLEIDIHLSSRLNTL